MRGFWETMLYSQPDEFHDKGWTAGEQGAYQCNLPVIHGKKERKKNMTVPCLFLTMEKAIIQFKA